MTTRPGRARALADDSQVGTRGPSCPPGKPALRAAHAPMLRHLLLLISVAHTRAESTYKFTSREDAPCRETHEGPPRSLDASPTPRRPPTCRRLTHLACARLRPRTVCIYGICCGDNDAGLACQDAELPGWAPDSMRLDSKCANNGVCMRRLVNDGEDTIIPGSGALAGSAAGGCEPTAEGRAYRTDCLAGFVTGSALSCTEPEPGKPRPCEYTPPAGTSYDSELGSEHVNFPGTSGIPSFYPGLPAQTPGLRGAAATQTWVRYCSCPENFCEELRSTHTMPPPLAALASSCLVNHSAG